MRLDNNIIISNKKGVLTVAAMCSQGKTVAGRYVDHIYFRKGWVPESQGGPHFCRRPSGNGDFNFDAPDSDHIHFSNYPFFLVNLSFFRSTVLKKLHSANSVYWLATGVLHSRAYLKQNNHSHVCALIMYLSDLHYFDISSSLVFCFFFYKHECLLSNSCFTLFCLQRNQLVLKLFNLRVLTI